MNPLVGLALAWLLFGRKSASVETESDMTRIVPLSIPGHYLRADAARAFEMAVSATSAPRVTSSYRSTEEQTRLYELWLAGKGNLAAKPGSSLHELGLAIDARGTPDWEEAMSAAGFHRPLMVPGPRYEPWHWEYKP